MVISNWELAQLPADVHSYSGSLITVWETQRVEKNSVAMSADKQEIRSSHASHVREAAFGVSAGFASLYKIRNSRLGRETGRRIGKIVVASRSGGRP